MIFHRLPLQGAFLIQVMPRIDERGSFSRIFCEQKFEEYGLCTAWRQANASFSAYSGTLRGMHFQTPPFSEVKLVRCSKGRVYDVVVDLRTTSTTFGRYYGHELTPDNNFLMYVPHGFAHGYQTLEDKSEVSYLVSQPYSPKHEGVLLFKDIDVSIPWPLSVTSVSPKDSAGKSLTDIFNSRYFL